ncbi:MAG: acyltransferase family protein [Thiotrichales bacterium]
MRGIGLFRVILALLVVDQHFNLAQHHLQRIASEYLGAENLIFLGIGHIAVYGFFVVTGFLIAFVWNTNYKLHPQGTSAFLVSRMLRIYPLHWIILTIFVVALFIVRPPELPSPQRLFLDYTLIPQGILGFFGDFGRLAYNTTNIPTWTLTYDLLFYLFAPFLMGSIRRLWTVLGIELVYATFCAFTLENTYETWHLRYFLAGHGLLAAYTIGALVYHYRERLRGPYHFWIGLLGLLLIALVPYQLGNYVVASVIVMVLFAVMVANTRFLAGRDVLIGDLTYPIYLLHFPFLELLAHQKLVPQYGYITALVATLIVSIAVLFLLEEPMKRLRKRITRLVADRPAGFGLSASLTRITPAHYFILLGALMLAMTYNGYTFLVAPVDAATVVSAP